MDDFETRLQRELQRVAGEARGPAPRAAQARYRQTRPSMLVFSRLAVGTATIAVALSASVVAAAAFSGARPTDFGRAVKVVVERCSIEQSDPGSQLGPCVSTFIPSGLPLLPTVNRPGDSTDRSGSGGFAQPAGSTGRRARSAQTSGTRPSPTGSSAPSQAPFLSGQPTNLAPGFPSPAPSAVTLPVPSATPPAATPAPTQTPQPTATATPVSTPSPTAPPGQNPGTDPGPSPSASPTPAPSASP